MRGLGLLKKHGVELNVLTTLYARNGDHPLRVYRFLRDAPADVMFSFAGRNDPCPCGSGKKLKSCHREARSPQ